MKARRWKSQGIGFPPDLFRAAKSEAAGRKKSFSAYVVQCVAKDLGWTVAGMTVQVRYAPRSRKEAA